MIEQLANRFAPSARQSRPSARSRLFKASPLRVLMMVTACAFAGSATAQSIYNDGGGTSGAARLDGGGPSGGYLDGGGPPRRPAARRYHRADDGFLRDGGGISQEPNVAIGNSRRRFLEDGGGVSTEPDVLIERGHARQGFLNDGGDIRREPDVLLGGKPRLFLSDGGSVHSTPRVRVAITPRLRDDLPHRGQAGRGGPGWRDLDTPEAIFTSNGSFTIVSGRGRRNAVVLSDVGDGGDGQSGGFDPIDYPPRTAPVARSHGFSGPKIIDVARDSLAGHPVRSGSIEILSGGHGGPKIIRIASDFGRGADSGDAAATNAPRVASADERARPGEPWTREWLSACSRRFASFDPQFGTYRDRSGAVKFCTGE